jgi:hypothetical protein
MSSKQLSSPPPTQPRRLYENTLRPQHYQQMDIRLNSHSATDRTVTPSYRQYPTISNRSQYNNGDFQYASSLYGTNRQASPTIITASSPLSPHRNRQIDLRSQSQHPQPRYLSRSVSDDYYTNPKYDQFNSFDGENYGNDQEQEDDDEEQCSETYNYTFDDTGVSSIKKGEIQKIYIYIKLISFPIHLVSRIYLSE